MEHEFPPSLPEYAEPDLIPISALQHWVYCPRQAMLIHLEQQWADNRFTAEGNLLHARTHGGGRSRRKRTETARTLHVRSLEIGLTGQCDVVEFREASAPDGDRDELLDDRETACRATGRGFRRLLDLPPHERARWRVEPVEYKRGRPKRGPASDCDRIQVAAQAVCLEEMLGITIDRGWLWYGQTKRRSEVVIDRSLRELIATTTQLIRDALASERTPTARYDKKKCDRCSLIEACMPRLRDQRQSARRWLDRMALAAAE